MRLVHVCLGLAAAAAWPAAAQAQTVSFSKEIVPIFREQCIKCHGTRQPQGGLSLASFAALEKGGKGGKVLAPKASDSRLIKYLDGRLQPKMPIGGSLTPPQIARITAWVDQGAKPDVDANAIVIPDSAIPAVKVPHITVKVPVLPQAAALAWSSDGKLLAVGTYQVVKIMDPATGQTVRELKGHADVVHALQFSRDGKLLAAAGGPPSQQGEVKIWDVATGNLVRTLGGHNDYVYSCSWGAEDKTLATASYDKLIKIWDVATGSEVKTLKDHADAVYAVAFNPAGNLLASASADRSVKVWDVASGKRIYTLAGHGDIVFTLAWNKDGRQITTGGADKTVRTWNINAAAGNQARSMSAHEKTVNEVAYSPDGSMMASASDDRTVKIWNATNGSAVKTIGEQGEGALSLAFCPDGTQVAIGGFDGTVAVYNSKEGTVVRKLIELPKAPPAPAAPAAKPAPAAAPAKK